MSEAGAAGTDLLAETDDQASLRQQVKDRGWERVDKARRHHPVHQRAGEAEE